MILTAESPCEAKVLPGPDGSLMVALFIPTYSGGVTLTLSAERSPDGDWVVFLPNTDQYDESNGIVYLGAPDVPCNRTDS